MVNCTRFARRFLRSSMTSMAYPESRPGEMSQEIISFESLSMAVHVHMSPASSGAASARATFRALA